MATLDATLLGEMTRRGWVRPGEVVLAGVSGGLDSVCLLHCLAQAAPTLGIRLAVAHANHGLRGEADAEAAFVQGLAADLGAPCHTGRLPVREAAAATGESIEMAARRLRHAFFAEAAAAAGANRVALAHHADDQVELLLVRLLRGAGPDGLGGMDWSGPSPARPDLTVIRPFLGVHRSALLAEATRRGWRWMEDPSNADRTILRNWVRGELLPLLERERGAGLRGVLWRTAELMRDEAAFMAQAASAWLAPANAPASAPAPAKADFAELPAALQREVLRGQLIQAGVAPDFALIEKLRTRAGRVSVGPGRWVRSAAGRVEIVTAPSPPTPASAAPEVVAVALTGARGVVRLPRGTLTWRRTTRRPARLRGVRAGERAPGDPVREWFDAAMVGARMRLRTWRPGDRFQPLGLPKAAKLQDLFTNAKTPRAERGAKVVAEAADGRIFWVEGLPPGESYKIRRGTVRCLQVEWKAAISSNLGANPPCAPSPRW